MQVPGDNILKMDFTLSRTARHLVHHAPPEAGGAFVCGRPGILALGTDCKAGLTAE